MIITALTPMITPKLVSAERNMFTLSEFIAILKVDLKSSMVSLLLLVIVGLKAQPTFNRHLTLALSWIIRGVGGVTSDLHLTGLRPTENPLSLQDTTVRDNYLKFLLYILTQYQLQNPYHFLQ